MIIKRVNIVSFGSLKNKVIDFCEGINLIYGENESGKSTIQSFIKIWLYGFSNSRGKELKSNERLKFMPSSGEKIRGELYIIHNGKEYIINRTFGRTKKEDTSIIIDGLTGEEIKGISVSEPGKYFLEINRATFIRTLFIGQLDVDIKKDKDEEILDKISNAVGIGEGDITVDRAFIKLENYRKYLSNSRKSGIIDKSKENYSLLVSERVEGYKLSDKNLENEKKLIQLNNEKITINEELSNLEIYKKYLKKKKLRKEYEDISKYLRKREELQMEEKSIESSLVYNNEIVTSTFINGIKEEYSMYLSLLDIKEEEKNKLNEKLEKINLLKEPLKIYEHLDFFNENYDKDIDRLKTEQQMLKEKVNISSKIEKEIAFFNIKEKEAREVIGDAIKIEGVRDNIAQDLKVYEEKLKELKYILELDKLNNSSNIIKVIYILLSVTSLIGLVFSKSFMLKIILLIVMLLSLGAYLVKLFFSGKLKSKREKVLQAEIKSIEDRLNLYIKQTDCNDYSELVKKIKLYDDYVELKEKIDSKINEKISQKEMLELDKAKELYIINEEKINYYLDIFNVATIDQLIDVLNEYKKVISDIKILEIEIKNQNEGLKTIQEQIEIREEKIMLALRKLGLSHINLLDLGEKLVELNERINKRDEIHRNLISMDETYAALSKGKDIDVIKDELKDIINITFSYSYETEDEIDSIIKLKSNRLLEVEKEIKDVENAINNRFNGKRRLPEIEEDISSLEIKIKEDERLLKGCDIAYEVLKESYNEIRESFGPLLNKNVAKAFKEFTNEKYSEVMVSDKYEMKLVSGNETFSADLLSSGANDQLYLALRLAFIQMIFNEKNVTLYLDDAFVQYDDKRVEKILLYLARENFAQNLIFTCQKREANILSKNNISYRNIKL
jgi:uncharacterized protein YhaN